jgi:uncharacterized protein
LVAWGYGGMLSVARLSGEAHPQHVGLYLLAMGEEWLMFALILAGVLRAGTPLQTLVGERWHSMRDLLRDIGIAAAFWVACLPVLYGLRLLVGATNLNPAVLALAPQSPVEITLWIVLCVTAGICEETIFRGYLQPQLMVMTGSKPAGMLLAAITFGLPHLYQGWRMAIVITVFGLMFGGLAYWRRSLRPGMIAHAWQDALTGVLAAVVLRR